MAVVRRGALPIQQVIVAIRRLDHVTLARPDAQTSVGRKGPSCRITAWWVMPQDWGNRLDDEALDTAVHRQPLPV